MGTVAKYIQCRSQDCDDRAEYKASTPKVYVRRTWSKKGKPALKREAWEGCFCFQHLMRVLEFKIREIPYAEGEMTIERIVH